MPTGYNTRHQGQKISETVEFLHQTITTLLVMPENRIPHGLTTLAYSLTDVPTSQSDAQRQAIAALHKAYTSLATPNERPDPSIPIPRPNPAKTRRAMKLLERDIKHPNITHQIAPRVPN